MDYNLGNKKNCLIGNWSEELALKDYAGHYRMPHDGAKGTSTYRRCVEHSLRYDVADLATTNRKDFNEPSAPHQNLTYKSNAMVGAREQLMMQKLKAAAAEKPMPQEQPHEWDTVAQSSYKWPEVDQHYTQTLGSKKMRSLDNGPIPGRDKTFVLEHGIVKPHICLETEEGKAAGGCCACLISCACNVLRLAVFLSVVYSATSCHNLVWICCCPLCQAQQPVHLLTKTPPLPLTYPYHPMHLTESPLMEQDIPITVYSANPGIHTMSVPTGTNPFGKDSAFSMPISQFDRAPVKDL